MPILYRLLNHKIKKRKKAEEVPSGRLKKQVRKLQRLPLRSPFSLGLSLLHSLLFLYFFLSFYSQFNWFSLLPCLFFILAVHNVFNFLLLFLFCLLFNTSLFLFKSSNSHFLVFFFDDVDMFSLQKLSPTFFKFFIIFL